MEKIRQLIKKVFPCVPCMGKNKFDIESFNRIKAQVIADTKMVEAENRELLSRNSYLMTECDNLMKKNTNLVVSNTVGYGLLVATVIGFGVYLKNYASNGN